MPYRNKVYIAFDGDTDIRYYYLMKAWKQSDNTTFNFYDAHEINFARDSSQEESIKKKLLERLRNSKCFVLLVGELTRYLYRFVRWEIEQAIRLDIPIVVVNLNGHRSMDENLCPPILKDHLAIHVPFSPRILEYALSDWTNDYPSIKRTGANGPYFYKDRIYSMLGL